MDYVWIINKGTADFTKVDTDLKKQIRIRPYRPIQLPRAVAMKYIKFNTLFACTDPEKYLQGDPLNKLIIRDAGIGDLLLLEPCLRQMNENENNVTVLTRFPEVYENNPYIKETIRMDTKSDLPPKFDVHDWDTDDDLRSYSETCDNRDTKHRTDCYNQIFNMEIKDKEPRLYFSKKEKSILNKKDGMNYIGVACDGSHYFRRYSKGSELVSHILQHDKKNVVVILGDGWEDGQGWIKYQHKDKRVINLQGKTTIRQAINIIKDLDYMISVDTGLMHVALTLHIPTVCIFSIIDPRLRIDYYTGQKAIMYKKELDCIGCGGWHMANCKHDSIGKDKTRIPPCLEFTPEEIYANITEFQKDDTGKDYSKIFYNEKKIEVKNIAVVNTDKKITLPIIVLNEEKNLPRFIELVMSHPIIDKVIAIDGGSTDNTVKLLEKAGAYVYTHPYDKDYHDAQALQRNVSFSFVKDGEKCIVMDIDECLSPELSAYLGIFCESNITYGLLSRRTFDYYADIGDPNKQIKDYPDYQPRLFTWDRKFKWIGSPHHNLYNAPSPVKIKKDIIHFEKEGKDRDALEKTWAKMHKATKEIYV